VKKQIQMVVAELQKKYTDFSLQTVEKNDIVKYTKDLTKEQIELLDGTIKNRDITKKARGLLMNTPLPHEMIGQLLTKHHGVLNNILKISTPKIDRMIDASLKAGAYGAKINGSGGGGCMFAYAPKNPEKVKEAIEKEGGIAYVIHADKGTYTRINEVTK